MLVLLFIARLTAVLKDHIIEAVVLQLITLLILFQEIPAEIRYLLRLGPIHTEHLQLFPLVFAAP